MQFTIPEESRAASGVYIIRNTVNEKVYVGSTNNFYQRHKSHLSAFANGKQNPHFQNFVNKHSVECLRFELLALCPIDQLLVCEQGFLDTFRCYERAHGYNAAPIAGRNAGWKATEEQRARYSAANKRKNADPAFMSKLIATRTGMKRPEGTGAKIAATKLGKPRKAEHRAQMALSHTGLKQSEATVAKRLAKTRGQKRTPEQLENIRRGIAAAKALKINRDTLPEYLLPSMLTPFLNPKDAAAQAAAEAAAVKAYEASGLSDYGQH